MDFYLPNTKLEKIAKTRFSENKEVSFPDSRKIYPIILKNVVSLPRKSSIDYVVDSGSFLGYFSRVK